MKAELRDLLIEHIDGPRPYIKADHADRNRVQGAVTTGLLLFDQARHPLKTPKATVLTRKGRQALSLALAQWADALKRAELLGLDVLASKVPDVKSGEQYLGKVVGGKFFASGECSADQAAKVLAFVADPGGAAKAYGIETGVCCVCNAALTSEWRLHGIGPVCSTKMGW
jgi:hypothetical protein